MFGLVFIYFIWKYFADLAELHQKNKWGWGIGAVVIFYAAQVVVGLTLGIIYAFQGKEIGGGEELIMNILGLIASIATITGLYYLLKNTWQNQRSKSTEDDILDFGKS